MGKQGVCVMASRIVVVVAGLALTGAALAADAPKANLQQTMVTLVNPQGLALWEITNGAMDAKGDLSASKLKAADWTKLLEIGKGLEEGGHKLATKSGVVAAPPGAKLQDEANPGAAKAADVQRYLDAQPEAFRKHALELQKTGASVIEAAGKHDVRQLAGLAGSLDEVCESCHLVFWNPKLTK
jgi:hypothetical protein